MKKLFVFLLVAGLLSGAGYIAYAAPPTTDCLDGYGNMSICLTNPLGSETNSISDLLGKIITYLYQIAGPILGIFVIIGGFQMLTAQDNETKFAKGKKTITYAAIGFAVILIADGVNIIIKSFFSAS